MLNLVRRANGIDDDNPLVAGYGYHSYDIKKGEKGKKRKRTYHLPTQTPHLLGQIHKPISRICHRPLPPSPSKLALPPLGNRLHLATLPFQELAKPQLPPHALQIPPGELQHDQLERRQKGVYEIRRGHAHELWVAESVLELGGLLFLRGEVVVLRRGEDGRVGVAVYEEALCCVDAGPEEGEFV